MWKTSRLRSVGAALVIVVAVAVVAATSPAPDELATEELVELRLGPSQPQVAGRIAMQGDALDDDFSERVTEVEIDMEVPAPPVVVEIVGQDGEVRAASVLGGAIVAATVEYGEPCSDFDCRAPLFYRIRAIETLVADVVFDGEVRVGHSGDGSIEPLDFALSEGTAPDSAEKPSAPVPVVEATTSFDGPVIAWYVSVDQACDAPPSRLLVVDAADSDGPAAAWVLADEPLRTESESEPESPALTAHRPDAGGGIVVELERVDCSAAPLNFWLVLHSDGDAGLAPLVWLDGPAESSDVTVTNGTLTTGDAQYVVTESGQRETLPFDDLASSSTVTSAIEVAQVVSMDSPGANYGDWSVTIGESAPLDGPTLVRAAGPCEAGACPPVTAEFESVQGAPELRASFALYRFEAMAP